MKEAEEEEHNEDGQERREAKGRDKEYRKTKTGGRGAKVKDKIEDGKVKTGRSGDKAKDIKRSTKRRVRVGEAAKKRT